MARYFFHSKNGKVTLDEEGLELADIDAVREEAYFFGRETVWATPVSEFWAGESQSVWVTDGPNATGETILRLELSATSSP
ncbi:DUF6894 family protein [Bradyrhizobium sp.]|uniref:DUF6894 family protein n=1 Tax=Bradyrhizobium sp. TaxID=376 RepID=UPI002E04EE71|nr:hypothetical protein [Bradyrhizobium sp.]